MFLVQTLSHVSASTIDLTVLYIEQELHLSQLEVLSPLPSQHIISHMKLRETKPFRLYAQQSWCAHNNILVHMASFETV
jgi:hypothetical protein